ncbi:MAG TPA: dihydropteroate synthase [Ferruginibacter sp.]|nr:dihydropteroate synthase [Ferruginibacter sp.]
MKTINCKGKLLTLAEPAIMGIINATPDSFYEGHLSQQPDEILSFAGKMISDGAAILDIGGMSTRPGSEPVSLQQEIDRLLPVIELIHKNFATAIISVDTYRSQVAKVAVDAGASIINDISSGTMDDKMITTVAALKVPYICMHIKGTPTNMQQNPVYENVVTEVLDYLIEKKQACTHAGINDVIIDPGFGFGKTIEHNFQLLKNLSAFSITDKPVLVGLSRKSSIYKTLGCKPQDALNGTTVLNIMALLNGADILRVHDVKEARESVMLYNAYKKA